MLDITWAISRLRGKVGGGKDQGLQSPRDGGANIVPADGANLGFRVSQADLSWQEYQDRA